MRKADFDGGLAMEPAQRHSDELVQLFFVREGNLKGPRIGLDGLGQFIGAVNHHECVAVFLKTVNHLSQDSQHLTAFEMLGQVQGDTNRTFLGVGEAAKAGRGRLRIRYRRAVGHQALADAAGDGPDQHITVPIEYHLAYDFQCVPFLIRRYRYTTIARIDQLFESFDIVH